ncbi:MAG: phosphatase PAP2 family protein [Chitinophagaceae bacterium]|nr:MAG: phosphatase PAP2 family protein [Chitinophagaceae bacterium]
MKKFTNLIFIALISTTFVACVKSDFPKHYPDKLPDDIIIQWNLLAYEAEGGAAYEHGPLGARSNAIVHIAMHDALNAIYPVYESYAYRQRGNVKAHPIVAAAVAAHTVLVFLHPESKTLVDAALKENLASFEEGELKENGKKTGLKAAQAILDLRANDDPFRSPVGFIPVSTVPGIYNVVPPFDFVFAEFWKEMKPFAFKRSDQLRGGPPPALTSDKYAESFNEIKSVGKLGSTTRTADQTAIAKWWYELSEKGWNRVARTLSEKHEPDLYTSARMFALINMAMSDSYVLGWDMKFYYNFWRPYTAIRAAATDGNDKTAPDPQWLSSEPTPPVQDWPSTHATLANSAKTILEKFFGYHAYFSMTSTSGVPASSVRSFSSLDEAADENAASRVYAGIHFRFSTDEGQKLGNKIGKWTYERYLQPQHK